jgi:hypothetical protein
MRNRGVDAAEEDRNDSKGKDRHTLNDGAEIAGNAVASYGPKFMEVDVTSRAFVIHLASVKIFSQSRKPAGDVGGLIAASLRATVLTCDGGDEAGEEVMSEGITRHCGQPSRIGIRPMVSGGSHE